MARAWLAPALATNVLWGAWGAWADLPSTNGFPPTLGFVVWVATVALVVVVMRRGVRPLPRDARAIVLGLAGGLPACAGNLLLFEALRCAPAHVVFPLVSLYPLIAVALGFVVLRERLGALGGLGVVAAIVAAPLLAVPADAPGAATTTRGLMLAALVAVLWGLQGFSWKLAEPVLNGDELVAYLLVSGCVLTPVALVGTDWHASIRWGAGGLGLAAVVQALNAAGVWTYARAMRRGPSVVVVPLTALAPVVTVVLSLLASRQWPSPAAATGMALATLSTGLLSRV